MSIENSFEINSQRAMFKKPKQKRFIRRKEDEALSLSRHVSISQEHSEDDASKHDTSQESAATATKIIRRAKVERLGREGMVFSNIAGTFSETSGLDEDTVQTGLNPPKRTTSDRFTTQSLQRNENLDKHM